MLAKEEPARSILEKIQRYAECTEKLLDYSSDRCGLGNNLGTN